MLQAGVSREVPHPGVDSHMAVVPSAQISAEMPTAQSQKQLPAAWFPSSSPNIPVTGPSTPLHDPSTTLQALGPASQVHVFASALQPQGSMSGHQVQQAGAQGALQSPNTAVAPARFNEQAGSEC